MREKVQQIQTNEREENIHIIKKERRSQKEKEKEANRSGEVGR